MNGPVATAVSALRHLQARDRDTALRLLSMYARRDELTPDERRQVIESFPAGKA